MEERSKDGSQTALNWLDRLVLMPIYLRDHTNGSESLEYPRWASNG